MSVMDDFRLDGHVGVITGGGRGIGEGIALAMAEAGADVVVAARRQHDLAAVVKQIEERGARGLAVPTDVPPAGSESRTLRPPPSQRSGRSRSG